MNREHADQRLILQTGIENKKFKWDQARESFTDRNTVSRASSLLSTARELTFDSSSTVALFPPRLHRQHPQRRRESLISAARALISSAAKPRP
jgi:hypothetical protein